MDLTGRMGLVAVATIRSGQLDLEVVDTIQLAPMAAVDNLTVPGVVDTIRLAPVAEVNRLDLAVVDTIHPAPMAVAGSPMVPVEAVTGLQGLVVAACKAGEAMGFTRVAVATSLKAAASTEAGTRMPSA